MFKYIPSVLAVDKSEAEMRHLVFKKISYKCKQFLLTLLSFTYQLDL